MACRTIATNLFILVVAAASFCQTQHSGTPETAQNQDGGESTSPAPSPSAPGIQPQLPQPQTPQPETPPPQTPQPQSGNIIGTVTDLTDRTVPGATVVLEGPNPGDHRTITTNDKGFFEFQTLDAGSYNVKVSAKGFADWISPPITLNPSQAFIVTGCKLKVAVAKTTINVGYASEQKAREQVKIEEQQRVFGFIPNFYVVYTHNAEPLTPKLKFKLALRTSVDPITFVGVGILAGAYQATDHLDYPQGAKGFGERFGAIYADGFSDIMIGGAVLPSLLHQDPRYFYQGTGTIKSRALHAMSNPFVCKGDNGKLQPNYSSVGGDLAASALSNAYYPPTNRGAGLMFENVLIDTAERVAASLAQEFLFRRFTTKAKKQQ